MPSKQWVPESFSGCDTKIFDRKQPLSMTRSRTTRHSSNGWMLITSDYTVKPRRRACRLLIGDVLCVPDVAIGALWNVPLQFTVFLFSIIMGLRTVSTMITAKVHFIGRGIDTHQLHHFIILPTGSNYNACKMFFKQINVHKFSSIQKF